MGFALYNVGFTAGLIGVVVVALLTSYELVPKPVFIWTTGHNLPLGVLMGVMVLSLMMLGLAIDRRAPSRLRALLRSSGQAPCDFIALAGLGATSLNVGLSGLLAMVYILMIGQFGWRWETLGGSVHYSAALSIDHAHGGLNLYNNGFASWIVASVPVPVIIVINAAQQRRRKP
jgi:hypothetical protein